MQVLRIEPFHLDRADGRSEPVELPASSAEEPHEHPLVLVEWHDAWFEVDEPTPQERRTNYPVRTVGFLIGQGPNVLSLAQEALPDAEGFRAITHIPVPIVQRVVNLEVTGS